LPPSSHVKEPNVTAHYEHYAHDEWSIGDLLHWLNYPSLPITFLNKKKSSIIKTPEESAEKSLGEAVIGDLKATVSVTKLKRSDEARAAMNIILID
jgi:hypothetical protein